MPFFINEGSVEITPFLQSLKGSDRICKVVELSMQSCGKLLSDSLKRHIELFKDL